MAANHIGTMIRRARERKRMSQEGLAQALGVSRSAVNAWERDRARPRSSIGALEEILGISISIGSEPASSDLVPQDDWERLVLEDETLPVRERAEIVRASRQARARLYPAPGPPSSAAEDAHQAREPRRAAG